ncbi:alcohol dehydrogenase [Clostridium thermosuccinogenes]|uniref:Alcohol dehydrogenase n=1 Tax=Clostridium thermosuccinogenes TaxID=84032 RepID=A0A2K2FD64_9CLOT|nr:zinc-dependent alcohol dehydrogenase family protein [Pseudoclostridium thermosuccinogenes]AUS97086.1 alcohol dehydrogenase [Pseudoclostridium thermosuccinogenes]PNT96696.1 alcohol dehydrogenase [Pseudoclostridium thermosuccinogenes]PNT98490.1 alcohol dehydrogenase [Pseudoclostridium thermosuccinogenes]
MKAAVYLGKHNLKVQDVEVRAPGPDEVLIQVKACGVCGTDLHIYEGAEGAAKCIPPTILGHEFSGIIHEVGSNVKGFKPGDRVCVDPNDMCGSCYYCRIGKAHFCENMTGIGTTVNGGFAEFCTVRAKQVYSIGESLSFEEGAMAEPVACCLHGMDLTGVKAGDTVMLIGGGTIGLIMLQLVKLSGASTIILVEPVQTKRDLALKLGADITIDPFTQSIDEILSANRISHIDAVIECVGLKNTVMDAVKYVGRGGTVMMFGLTHPDCEIPLKPFDVFKKEYSIKASFINPYTQGRAVSLLKSGRINVKDIITDKIKLADINKVFEDSSYRSRGKIIIEP